MPVFMACMMCVVCEVCGWCVSEESGLYTRYVAVWGTGQRRVRCALGGVMYIMYVKCVVHVRWCDSL